MNYDVSNDVLKDTRGHPEVLAPEEIVNGFGGFNSDEVL